MVFPVIAIIMSAIALYFSRKSFLDANRPIILVNISSQGMGGNAATPLSLIVENTGNRPALDIVIKWHGSEYKKAFKVPEEHPRRSAFERIYSEGARIEVLANGKKVTTSFGWIGPDDMAQFQSEAATWHSESRFCMAVSYRDLDGRKYNHEIPMITSDDEGFGGGIWQLSK